MTTVFVIYKQGRKECVVGTDRGYENKIKTKREQESDREKRQKNRKTKKNMEEQNGKRLIAELQVLRNPL